VVIEIACSAVDQSAWGAAVVVVDVMGAAIWSAVAVFWMQGAVRTWRGTWNLSSSWLFRVQSAERRRNIDRCAPCVALLLLCVSVTFVAAIAMPNRPPAPTWLTTVGALAFFGAPS
jgi:hypothetical protein